MKGKRGNGGRRGKGKKGGKICWITAVEQCIANVLNCINKEVVIGPDRGNICDEVRRQVWR